MAGRRAMIQLTRLNNQPLLINSDLIKFPERSPDTMLTLLTGEKVIVRETPEEVLKKVIAFRQAILAGLSDDLRHTAGTANVAPSAGETERKS